MSLAIVTGGSRGIGAAIVKKLAAEGYDVVINCVSNVAKAEAVAEECRALGVQAYPMAWDVSDSNACQEAAKKIKAEIGVPDVLVNNAGITRDGLMIRLGAEKWNEVIQANLNSVFYMTSAIGAQMMRKKAGSIVNITSISGLHGNFGQANYTAAKAVIADYYGVAGGCHWTDQDGSQGAGQPRHSRQCSRSGLHSDGYDGCSVR